jgi:hypothetical protein
MLDLTEFDNAYQSAEAAEIYTPPPAGAYTARIDSVKFGQVGEQQKTKLLWSLRITEGELTGRRVLFDSALSPAAMPFLKANLAIVGINVPRLSEVPPLLPGVEGAVVKISVKHSDKYVNVDLMSLVSPGTGPAAAAPVAEDDVPFD